MWADPFTAFGDISIFILISNIATLVGFFLASFFALRYTNKFYEGRPTSKSWFLLILGLSIIVISETLQLVISYRVDPIELLRFYNTLSIIIQSFGIILVTLGCFFIYKEVS